MMRLWGFTNLCPENRSFQAEATTGVRLVFLLSKMKSFIPIVAMALLTAFVLQTAVRIEVMNVRAGYYLPRTDRNPDGTFADGKWRISQENTPRDQLRDLVQTFGLLQYVLAPLLFILSVALLLSRRTWVKVAATMCMFVATAGISLAVYRGYYPALGW